MRHFNTLVLTLTLAECAVAQPILTSTDMLAPGITTYMRELGNYDAVDTTIQGANATWNFVGILPDLQEPPFSLTIVDPATTPYPGLFSADNYAYWEEPNNYYRYFELTPTYMQRLGSHTLSDYVMADPQVEYVFPLTLGTTHLDTWWGVNDGGNYKINCVGYGTLMLPGITFQNALMVRADISGTAYDIDAYFWYSGTDGRILLQYLNTTLTLSSLYYDADANAVHEQQAFQPTLLGNPVSNELNFVLGQQSGPLDYVILSSAGARMAHGQVLGNAGTVQTIDTGALSAGLYFLQLSDGNAPARSSIRFVKE
jgi:hypothetical protein